jgi:hypothetical protein
VLAGVDGGAGHFWGFLYRSMVVGDFDVARAGGAVRPFEADAVLVVDPDAELAFPVSNQRFDLFQARDFEMQRIVRIGVTHAELRGVSGPSPRHPLVSRGRMRLRFDIMPHTSGAGDK